MLYYFSLNVTLLSVKCYITFGRMLYYFLMEVILLLSEIPLLPPESRGISERK